MQNLIQQIKKNGIYIDSRGNLYGSKYSDCINTNFGLWQKPAEFSALLTILNTQSIQTFLNIGTFNGYTFNFVSDYLNAIRPTSCITVDPNDFIGSNKKYPYIYLSCTSDTFKNIPFDLVFIDGDHSYQAVKKDWEKVGKERTKMYDERQSFHLHHRSCIFQENDRRFCIFTVHKKQTAVSEAATDGRY